MFIVVNYCLHKLEREREGGREREREEGREGGRERGREGGREKRKHGYRQKLTEINPNRHRKRVAHLLHTKYEFSLQRDFTLTLGIFLRMIR